VICISGESLFGSKLTTDARPLRSWADRGKLDVVMPVSAADNPTLSERYETYSAEVKATRYSSVDDLIAEADAGKEYLLAKANTVTEHNLLCMWRAVILQNYCIVQNYFPNSEGGLSDFAPALVYQNTGKYSYYQMYLEMSHIIKTRSSSISS